MVIRSRLPREEKKQGIASKMLGGIGKLGKAYYDAIPVPASFEKKKESRPPQVQ
jgi:hypothetical protein